MSKPKTALIVCAVLHAVNHCQWLFLVPLYPAMQADLGFNTVSPVLLLSAVYFFFYAVFSIPFGIMGDRFSKKLILIYSLLISSIALGLCGLTLNYKFLLVLFAISGASGGAYHPVSNSFVTLLFPNAKGQALGAIGMGASISFTLTPLASGYLGQVMGWQKLCLLVGFAGIVLSVLFLFLIPDFHGDKERRSTAAKERQKSGFSWLPLIPLVLVYSFRELANYGFAPLTSFMGQTIHGFSPAHIGLMLSLVSLPGIIIQPLFGYLSDRMPRELITIISLFTAAVFVLLVPWAPAGFLILCFLLVGAATSANIPVLDAITAEKVSAVNRSTVYGFLMAVGIGAGSFSPVICGGILDVNSASHTGFKTAYLVLFLFGQAAALTMLIAYLKRRK